MKYSFNKILSLLLLVIAAVSIITVVRAAAPNPGHDFTAISGGVAQGDLLYGSAADTLSALAKDATASRYLSNSGSSNNPAWAQVNLTNGVTGSLPLANVDPIYVVFSGATPSLTADANCSAYGGSCANNDVGHTRIPVAMTLSGLYARMTTAPASANSCAFTVQVASDPCTSFSNTSLTCVITGNGSLRNCSDTSNSPSISAGQCIRVFFDETGTCTGIDDWTFYGQY